VHVADPHGAWSGAGGNGPRLEPDGDLAHDLVRPWVDHADVVRTDRGKAARPISEQQDGCEARGEDEERQECEREPPTPERHRRDGGRGHIATHGGKGLGQTIRSRLVETHETVEVFQALLAEVAQGDVKILLLLVLEQRLRRLGDKDLAAMGRRADARRTMDGKTRVPAILSRNLAGVEAHPDLDLDTVGPGMGTKRELTLDRGQQRLARACERDEERIALRVDLVTVVSLEGPPEHALMVAEDRAVVIAQLLHEPRRALDIREEEGDSASGRLDHRP
jgi:hypothetical protein